MKIIKKYLKTFLSGIIFGTANVIPGVSGGTMLVIFGVFDTLTDAVSSPKKIIKNLPFLLSFFLGAGAGIIVSAFLISEMFEMFGIQTNMFFIGLILGGIPLIYRFGTAEKKIRPSCLIPFIIALAAVIALSVTEKTGVFSLAPDTVTQTCPECHTENTLVYGVKTTCKMCETTLSGGIDLVLSLKLVVCAAFAAITMIIPGISGSFVMMLLGVYETIIGALKGLNFFVIIPFAVGAAAGIMFGSRLISMLIKKNTLMVYSALMGLVVGSVYAILPDGFGFNIQTGYGFTCLIIGIIFSVLLEKIGKNTEQ